MLGKKGGKDWCFVAYSVAGEGEELGPGDYQFKYTFILPQRLPTSFEGVYGYVRYYVRAQLDRGCNVNSVFKRAFTVNNIVDLNRNAQAAVSIRRQFLAYPYYLYTTS